MSYELIEKAFALLKGRWRQLQYLNLQHVENATNIILAACVLHNLALMNGEDITDFLDDLPEGDVFCMPFFLPENSSANDKRNRIAEYLM